MKTNLHSQRTCCHFGPDGLPANGGAACDCCDMAMCGACDGRGGFAASGETCSDCLGTGTMKQGRNADG